MPEVEKVNYVQGQHKSVLNRHAARTADENASFIFAHLDSLPADFTFLDLGCGPGSITTDLARKYPQASFVGVDAGEIALEKARSLAEERGTKNVEFRVGDIMRLDGIVPLDHYDVVYCSQVLIHMQQPLQGFKIMKAHAKQAGGLVAARESDLEGGIIFYPETAGTRGWQDAFLKMQRHNGSDPRLGRKMVEYALNAGWTRDQITASLSAQTLDTPEQKTVFYDSVKGSLGDADADMHKRLLKLGLATEDELQEMVRGWTEWFEAPHAWASFLGTEIVCRNS